MGSNENYQPRHSHPYTGNCDGPDHSVMWRGPQHVKPATMADFRPMGANR